MATYTWMDAFILVVIVLSTFISIVRGFMKETLSLLGWIGAFYLAYRYFETISANLEGFIGNNSLRFGLSFMVIFIVSIALFGLITYGILKVLKISGMSLIDRLFGAVFGAARGVLIVNLFIVVGSTLSLSGYVWWQQSFMIQHLTPQVVWLKENLPEWNKKFQMFAKREQYRVIDKAQEIV